MICVKLIMLSWCPHLGFRYAKMLIPSFPKVVRRLVQNFIVFCVCNKNVGKTCTILHVNERNIIMKVENQFKKIELSKISLWVLDMQIAISNYYNEWYPVSTLYKCQQLTVYIICFCHLQADWFLLVLKICHSYSGRPIICQHQSFSYSATQGLGDRFYSASQSLKSLLFDDTRNSVT